VSSVVAALAAAAFLAVVAAAGRGREHRLHAGECRAGGTSVAVVASATAASAFAAGASTVFWH
jgi:hypothetical protein